MKRSRLRGNWHFRPARAAPGGGHGAPEPAGERPGEQPFGGEKNSGIGRFGGDWAVDAFTTDKWMTVQHVPRQFPANANVLLGPWASG